MLLTVNTVHITYNYIFTITYLYAPNKISL